MALGSLCTQGHGGHQAYARGEKAGASGGTVGGLRPGPISKPHLGTKGTVRDRGAHAGAHTREEGGPALLVRSVRPQPDWCFPGRLQVLVRLTRVASSNGPPQGKKGLPSWAGGARRGAARQDGSPAGACVCGQ